LVDVNNVSEFAIEEPGLLIEADGEIVGETPAIVKVCPAALKIKL
jgi:diacylglycerol kinase family enzyme